MTLGERMRRSRRAAKLSQAELAAAVEVSQPTVARWERGEVEPSQAAIRRIARALGAAPEWLAFGDGAEAQARSQARSQAQGKPAALARREAAAPAGAGVIAFQGIPGAFSHLACREAYPGHEPLPCVSFEAAFAAVEEGAAELCMIPIENSLGGRVADMHHLLPDSSLYIVAEHFQPVQHHLLAPPGATLEGLKRVFSHVQALAQCKEHVRELGLEAVARADTAGAAKEVAALGDPQVGAIASGLAGEIYGLETLRTRIEDRIGNTTRMVVMSRRRQEPDLADGPCVTSFIFQVRSVPAALYKSLGGFATNGINIIKLESYITDSGFTVAQFYAEIEGHPAQKPVDRALDELQYFSTKLKILGVYPQDDFRRQG